MRISFAESQVMETLWRKSPLSTEEIAADVGPANDWALGTVRTLLHRLLKKNAIEGQRKGARYEYRPLIERAQYLNAESKSLLDRLFEGELGTMVAHFADTKALTQRDIETMKRLIADIEDDA